MKMRFLRNVRVYAEMYTGILGFIVKLPEDVCANHTKRAGELKSLRIGVQL